MIKTLIRCFRWLVILLVLVIGALYWSSRTVTPGLPPGVQKEVRFFTLAAQQVSVTLYYPASRTEAPLVLVAHGFTRSKRYMAGWGTELAKEGFVAAVLTQPALANHELNAQVIAELVAELHRSDLDLKVRPSAKTALVGFSMGGLTTLLAAGKQPVDAWIGLDPVGMDDSWLSVGKGLHIPCAVLRAEPAAWNKNGNARDLFAILSPPKFSLKVIGATHLDPESPTDFMGQLVCGRTDPKKHELFVRYAIAFIKATLLGDSESKQIIAGAKNDPALSEVEGE